MWGQAWGWLATWAVSGLAVLGASLVAVANDAFKGWLKGLPGGLLFVCGGERRFLDRYAADLHTRHHEVPIPFAVPSGPDVKISVASVYVPLRAAEGISSRGLAAAEALGWEAVDALLAAGKKVIVCGDPGAGKSMYLRRAVLAWAESRGAHAAGPRREARRERVPVLLELHELKPDALDPGVLDPIALLAQHLASPAGRNVPERWILRQLLAGRVTFYLDGLDEVPAAERRDLVHWIRDVARKYPKAGMIVTCRTAVYPAYRDHLKEVVDRSLAIQEFTDLHIHQFLRGWRWPERTAPDSVDRLLKALGEVPRLMSLARNPLLLTAIAYLYSYVYPDTDRELPRTRAEFYQQVSDAFVDDRGRQGEFDSELKRAVLCSAGLRAQDALADSADRRSVEQGVGREFSGGVLMEWVAGALERQHETPDKARRVIDEICVRSGLLSKLENGRYYQFAHLSLQEYLAAEALADDWTALLARYDADPARWRETVRLWCGVTRRDCSPMIRDLRARDVLLAFQCLAEARRVDGDLIQEMVLDAGDRLGSCNGDDAAGTALEAALGVAGTGPAAMSDMVFSLLVPLAHGPAVPEAVHGAAIRALAATASSRAAHVLVWLPHRRTATCAALASMGDIAVPALREAALKGNGPAVDALGMVGTGRAAVALADIMTMDHYKVSLLRRPCAVLLGGLIAEPEVVRALRERPGDDRVALRSLERAWAPFAEGAHDPVIPLMGTVATMVHQAFQEGELPAEARLDGRLVAALLLLADRVGAGPTLSASEHLRDLVITLGYSSDAFAVDLRTGPELPRDLYAVLGRRLIDYVVARPGSFDGLGRDGLYRMCCRATASQGNRAQGVLRLLDELPLRERLLTLGLRWRHGSVHPQVWETCADPRQDFTFDFDESRHYRFVLGLFLLVSAVAAVRAVLAALGVDPWGPAWLGWAAVSAILVGWFALWHSEARTDPVHLFRATVPFAHNFGYGAPEDAQDSALRAVGFVLGPATAVYSYAAWSSWWGTAAAIVISVAIVAAGSVAVRRGRALDRRARKAKDIPRLVAREVVTGLRRRAGTVVAD
ncbi:NACHT domain-containing protein [Streptomyces sp. NPDC051214]|uniref:NACHT domain-containing protein n=1 Tax=Streptomyces sp. NPDC051214 TaxID=3155282 RepID=UPI003421D6BF